MTTRKARANRDRTNSNAEINTLRNRIRGVLKETIGKRWRELVTFKVIAHIRRVEFQFNDMKNHTLQRVHKALAAMAKSFRGATYCSSSHELRLAS